jgi:prepilin-type N-terminal cleavage/methylation domain-containing protein
MKPLTSRSKRAAGEPGFTLVELMIVVVVIGILAAIAIPNFVAMQRRAQEGSIKSNMHTVQVSLEDFALQNDFKYPTSGSDVLPDGRNLAQICPTGAYPKNPFTNTATVVQFNSNPTSGAKGEIGINPAIATSYKVKANGSVGDTLPLVLTSGQ